MVISASMGNAVFYGKRQQYNQEVQVASFEKLAKLIYVAAMLLQTKVYLFWH